MAGKRATRLETDKRVFTIQGWIISAVPDYLILKNIQQDWELGRRMAKYLLKKAYTIWLSGEVASMEEKRMLRVADLKQDIRSMQDRYKGTPQGMMAVLRIKKEINKLDGIVPVRQLMIQGDPEKPIQFEEATDRDKRIAYLMAKMNAVD